MSDTENTKPEPTDENDLEATEPEAVEEDETDLDEAEAEQELPEGVLSVDLPGEQPSSIPLHPESVDRS